jgi:hypothetical protein
MKKLTPQAMEKTQGGFLFAFLLGVLAGIVFLTIQDGFANAHGA